MARLLKVTWLTLLFVFPCALIANEQAEMMGQMAQKLPVATGEPFSGAEQVFNLGKEHGQLLRAQIIKVYCHVAKCDEAKGKEENPHEQY